MKRANDLSLKKVNNYLAGVIELTDVIPLRNDIYIPIRYV